MEAKGHGSYSWINTLGTMEAPSYWGLLVCPQIKKWFQGIQLRAWRTRIFLH